MNAPVVSIEGDQMIVEHDGAVMSLTRDQADALKAQIDDLIWMLSEREDA